MVRSASVILIAVLLAAGATPALAEGPSIAGLLSELPHFQWGGAYGGGSDIGIEQGYGGGGGGAAQAKNIRLSFHFLLVSMQNDEVFDDSSSESWYQYWGSGLGGSVAIAYQFVPGFRAAFGTGYHTFPGKEHESGSMSYEWDSMQCIPFRLEGTVCLPFDLPSDQWFSGTRGFVEGPVPYAGIEIAGVYRPEVEVDFDWGGLSATGEMIETGFSFFFGGRIGFEYRTQSVGLFADLGVRYYTAPKEGDDAGDDVMPMTTGTFRMGIAVYFGGGGGGGF